jgi:CheY-like chemotaxis protein
VLPGGEQALELLKSGEKFDLVTTDVKNAPLDGIGFLEQLKKNFPDVPVVMLTGTFDKSICRQCIRRGARSYLLKPFTHNQLIEVVHRALEYHRLPWGVCLHRSRMRRERCLSPDIVN